MSLFFAKQLNLKSQKCSVTELGGWGLDDLLLTTDRVCYFCHDIQHSSGYQIMQLVVEDGPSPLSRLEA